MYVTTLNKIRACSPCEKGWKTLLSHLGKTQPDDEALPLATILDAVGIKDALWSLCAFVEDFPEIARKARGYAVWCARQVEHKYKDQREYVSAIDVADKYVAGMATLEELQQAYISVQMVRNRKGDFSLAMSATMTNFWEAANLASRNMDRIMVGDALSGVPYDEVIEPEDEPLSIYERIKQRERTRTDVNDKMNASVNCMLVKKFCEMFL